jgi:tetratricopeptide (TPR) repeat protein
MKMLTRILLATLLAGALTSIAQSQSGVADSYLASAHDAYQRGHYGEAVRLFALALIECKNIKDVDLAYSTSFDSLNGMEGSLVKLGRFADAEVVSRDLVKLVSTGKGEQNEGFTVALNNLGLVLEAEGKLEEAEKVHRQALSIKETLYGPKDPNVAVSLMNIGMVRLDQRKYPEAEALFRRAVDIFRNARTDDPDDILLSIAQCYANLGVIYGIQGKNLAAVANLTTSIAIREKVQGLDHPDLERPLKDYARVLRSIGKPREALAAEAHARRIVRNATRN